MENKGEREFCGKFIPNWSSAGADPDPPENKRGKPKNPGVWRAWKGLFPKKMWIDGSSGPAEWMKFPLFEEENLKFPQPNSIILGVDFIKIHGKFPMETLLLMEMKLNIQTFFQKANFPSPKDVGLYFPSGKHPESPEFLWICTDLIEPSGRKFWDGEIRRLSLGISALEWLPIRKTCHD